MIPAKIDSISATAIKETGVEFIFDWFEQNQQSFYILGWCFLGNQQQIGELFYRSIVQVQKEWPRYKGITPFQTWVTSIFIRNCRELSHNKSSDEFEQNQNLFQALYHLKMHEKEAVVLTYVKGFSLEEAAHLLEVPVEKMKEILLSAIQSLRSKISPELTFNGCKEYQEDYIDYLEKDMERSKKIDFEVHIYHCQNCQEDLSAFQDVMLTMLDLPNRIGNLHVPPGFIENIKNRLLEKEQQRQQKRKKRKKIGMAFASVFALLIGVGFFTGAFTYVYYAWTEENLELRAFLQQDLGERLNLEAESNGVKIKIKSAIADDVQTLVYYEIEDTNEDNQYMMGYSDGVIVENEYEIMNHATHQRYYPPDLQSDINTKAKNVYHGKMSLHPLTTDNGTIKLKVTSIQKLINDSSKSKVYLPFGDIESKRGEWSFEIPVTKKPSIEYALKGRTEVEGIPVRFDKLIIAPTATILQFSLSNNSNNRIFVLNFNQLEVNKKPMKPDIHGSTYLNSHHDVNWSTLQAHFDPLLGEKPKEVKVQFASAYLSINDNKTIELAQLQEYPQTFVYAGSTISIDRLEVGQDTTIVMSNHEIENRAYESLNFNIISENGQLPNSTEMDSEGVFVDKNGVQYDENRPFSYEELEQPRYFQTFQSLRLKNFKGVPGKLEIYGYHTTKYLDDVVEISLE